MVPDFERLARSVFIAPYDHEDAAKNILSTTFESDSTLLIFTAIEAEQKTADPDTYDQLSLIGRYLIPLDADGVISDDMQRYHGYVISMNLALATLDALCDQHDIDIESFRDSWRSKGLVRLPDPNDDRIRSLTPREQYEAVAAGIMASGHAAMEGYGTAYDDLLDAAGNINQATAANPAVIRASFGYILGRGVKVMNEMLQEREVERLTLSQDIDTVLTQWSADTTTEKQLFSDSMNHEVIANDMDTEAFYSDESVETYLDRLVERQLDKDEIVIEIINSLALVMYPNGLGNYSLDETGEAFFLGSVLALDTVERYAVSQMVDEIELKRRWRKQHMHNKLQKLKWLPETRPDEVDHLMRSAVTGRSLQLEYSEVLTKISFELDHDEEEAAAFYQGFYYLLSTSGDAVKACKAAAITEHVKASMQDFDDELKRLLEG